MTAAEIIEAIAAAAARAPTDDGTVTTAEVGKAMGWSENVTRKWIKAKLAAGEMRAVKTRRANSLDHRMNQVPGFVWVGRG